MMEVIFLPQEITADILSRLPVDSIVTCKSVCKTWRTLIVDPLFLYAYNNKTSGTAVHCRISNSTDEAQPFGFFIIIINLLHYGEWYKEEEEEEEEEAHFKFTKPLKYPPLPCNPYYNTTNWVILGSSNGLICLSACRCNGCKCDIFTYNIYVYNPMTREFVDVGTETHMGAVIVDGGGFRASGFGYHPSTKEYKVVRINYKTNLSHSGQVRVYTLGSGSWRDKKEIPYVIIGVTKPGVLVNGALYWITLDKKILSFDLADEEFRIVSKPWEINPLNVTRLGVLRGCLSVGTSGENHTDVWIMNNNKSYMSSSSSRTTDDDDEPSWTRLTIAVNEPPGGYRINDRWAFNGISSYGIEYESFGRFLYSHVCKGSGFDRHNLHVVPFTKSFVSLKALGEENVKKIC